MGALGLARIDASIQEITILKCSSSRLCKGDGRECSKSNPAAATIELEAEEPVLRTAHADPKNQSGNGCVRDVAFGRTGTKRSNLRRRQPSERRSGGHSCWLGGHPVDTFLCDALHPNATACNLREAFVTSSIRKVRHRKCGENSCLLSHPDGMCCKSSHGCLACPPSGRGAAW